MSTPCHPRSGTDRRLDRARGLDPAHVLGLPAERGEDRQVHEAGGRHHRGVARLPEGADGDLDEHRGGDGARHPEPSEHPAPSVVDGTTEDTEHPGRKQHHDNLDGQNPSDGDHQFVQDPARQTGLHEVPVTEEHRVADGTQEDRADEDTVVAHYRAVAEVGLPLMAYNNPYDTKVDLTPPVGSVMGNSYGITVVAGVTSRVHAKAVVFATPEGKAALVEVAAWLEHFQLVQLVVDLANNKINM